MKTTNRILWIGAITMLAMVIILSLAGCGDTITSSVKPDWRSIHQPAPTTPN